jgi:hypothetical protein
MEGRDVAMLLASAVVGVLSYKYMQYLSCRHGSHAVETIRQQTTEGKESTDSELTKENEDGESEDEDEDDEDFPPTENIKDNYTLASGKFKMVCSHCLILRQNAVRRFSVSI